MPCVIRRLQHLCALTGALGLVLSLPADAGLRLISDLAGMYAPAIAPWYSSSSLAVSADGKRLAVGWLHVAPGGLTPYHGEPTTHATVGEWPRPASFAAPVVVGKRLRRGWAPCPPPNGAYNAKHNAPLLLATPTGGFLALSQPMNAVGHTDCLGRTGDAFIVSEWSPSGGWSPPAASPIMAAATSQTASGLSGGFDRKGALHLFGQGHAESGHFVHMRRGGAREAWRSTVLARKHQPAGMNYFLEGVGGVEGDQSLHVAFGWNNRGASPQYGLSYLRSRDGGQTWTDASGTAVQLPLRASDSAGAVVPSGLRARGYGGAMPGTGALSLAVTPAGHPLIVRHRFVSGDKGPVRAWVHAFTGRGWVECPVGPPVGTRSSETAVAFNRARGTVNVLLLDPGGPRRPSRVLHFATPLESLLAGAARWDETVAASAPTPGGGASGLRAAIVPDTRFIFLFEPSWRYPGTTRPVLGEAPLR